MAVSTKQDPATGRPPRRRLANAIRALAMDAVEAANSGHPGMPMGMADIAEVLWNDYPAPQPGESAVARPRPLRAVERPRLDAAVRAAAPDRLRPADRGAASASASCTRKTAGPSRVSDHARRRDDDRPARPGPRQRGRHGARREAARRASSTAPGFDDRRPLHLRLLRRRLPDGRHLARGLLARRHAGSSAS